jgi:hypothetical protein
MSRWKVLSTLRRPKVRRTNSNSPNGVMMAAFQDVSRVDRNLIIPLRKSIFEKIEHPATLEEKSIMFGSGYVSGTVTLLSPR